ncbi:Mu transposase C-terminal domain-containing protein [Microbulbifer sp. VAAF005]|uniref:Mu transposase C-terminal domain-containing protein n=1 Tax=Microbulbifer sp. VAAF005 TaxID=3034230 RepID=UPI0024AE33F9|nr:Mu transposase C-terminal domain-containing protein [Microbulbifer sp. VAAF005]WHI44628.1 DDE-type integrase/transposase/recombinase [Microbulbifer sp. VAAF005]
MKNIKPGQLIYWRDEAAIVLELKGFSEFIIRTLDNSKTEIAHIKDISISPSISSPKKHAPHLSADDKEWDKAVKRFELIKPLLEMQCRTAEDVKNTANNAGKSITTIYRWIRRFEETGLVSSLLRVERADKGETKLSQEVEEIVNLFIQKNYLRKERPSVVRLYNDIKNECKELDLDPPHKNTIYARVHEIDEKQRIKKRYGTKVAKQKYEPIKGQFPGGKFPNAIVQIDHTKVDLIIVDEDHRLPIGRPYMTIAIDVATKMITGFRITLDPPSASTAGLCIAHAVLRKEHWLAKRDVHAEWPVYGKMEMIHVDNAKEFRGKMLERACREYGITLEHRPRGQPNYGPHVERAFRTFMKESHNLPGTTFSSVGEKLDYDSEGRACLTLSELELWFTIFIVYCYHHREHRGINDVAPIKLYQKYIQGTSEFPGVGLPAPIDDEETFRLNFTPYVERTIQRDGVVVDNIYYYSPILRPWVGSTDPNDKRRARKFIFARDPRDISVIYFLDPITNTYCPVPYLNNTRPAISLWELKFVVKKLNEDEYTHIDENMIFKGIKKMREVEAEAIEKTRLARQHRASEKRKRRMAARRPGWKDIHSKSDKAPQFENPSKEIEINDEDIKPFNDIQVGRD